MDNILSGIIGAFIGGGLLLLVERWNRRQQFYLNWFHAITEHNWKLAEYLLDSGLKFSDEHIKVRVVCYQHLNLLFLAWQNRKVIRCDGTIEGLKNFANLLIEGAKNKKAFSGMYKEILEKRDLYPEDFISWLDNTLGISVKKLNN